MAVWPDLHRAVENENQVFRLLSRDQDSGVKWNDVPPASVAVSPTFLQPVLARSLIVVRIETGAVPELDQVCCGGGASLQSRLIIRSENARNRPLLPNLVADWCDDPGRQIAREGKRSRSVRNDAVGRSDTGRGDRSIDAGNLDEVRPLPPANWSVVQLAPLSVIVLLPIALAVR